MLRNLCDSPIHKWLSALLAFIFIFFIVLSVPAAADSVRPNEPVGWKDGDTFRDILLAVLDSWGISFSKSDSSDDTSILEYSDQLMQQFYDANQTTQELFWDAVKFGASETGNIILDFLGVNKIRQFANWLIDKFSLTDNSSFIVSSDLFVDYDPSISPSNVPSFSVVSQSSTYYHLLNYNNALNYILTNRPGITLSAVVSPDLVSEYFIWSIPAPSSFFHAVAVRYGSNAVYPVTIDVSSFPSLTSLPSDVSDIPYDNCFYFDPYLNSYLWFTRGNGYQSLASSSGIFYSTSLSRVYDFLSPINLTIVTQVIDVPSEDIDPDDGLQIEVPGTNWGDSIYTILDIIERLIGLYDSTQLNINSVIDLISTLLQGLQSSVIVENIPGAVTLDYDEYDIPLETEWALIDDFYGLEYSEDDTLFTPFDTLKSLIFGLPEPLLLFLSVMIVWIVAYGFIRMGRDSH